ncbi:MAG: GNAT family N-acetyltransferase [Gemmatimonadaceae bacterium]
MTESHVTPALPSDADAVRALLATGVPASYRSLLHEHLERALIGTDREEHLLVSRDRPAGAVTGFALFGIVPGTIGAGRLRGIAIAPLARRRGVGRALLTAACRELQAVGARFVLVELPDEPEARFLWALLEAHDFREEARAAELVRPGVDMRYVRRELGPRWP